MDNIAVVHRLAPYGGMNNIEKQLIGINPCREEVFPHPESRPSLRLFNEWRARGYIPYHKIGKRVFMDPEQVRMALDRQFMIRPTAAEYSGIERGDQ